MQDCVVMRTTLIPAWISNYTHSKACNYVCIPKLQRCLMDGYLNQFHPSVWLFIHDGLTLIMLAKGATISWTIVLLLCHFCQIAATYWKTSTGIDAGASKGKSWPGYSWQQSGLMLRMWDTGFITTLCHCNVSMINWIMPNLHVVILPVILASDGP